MPNRSGGTGFATSGWSQADQRVTKVFWDQHRNAGRGFPTGRAWWATCEKQVNGSDAMPVGELTPVSANMLIDVVSGELRIFDGKGSFDDGHTFPDGSTFVKGWHAPWTPEPKYVVMALSGLRGNRFRIDYTLMRKEYEEANVRYYDLVNNESFEKGWKAVELYGNVPYTIRALKHVGAPPKSPKVPEAALAGDLWLLGFSDEVNEKLEAILAADNGRLVVTATDSGESNVVPVGHGLDAEELAALREMVAAKRAREAKKRAPAGVDAA